MDGLDVAILGQEQGLIPGISHLRDIHIGILPGRDGKHIVEIDNRIVFDFDKVQSLRYPAVLFLEGGQRGKVVHAVDRQNDAYVLALVALTWLLVLKQVGRMGRKIPHIGGGYLVQLDVVHISLLAKTTGARLPCPRCYTRTQSGETLTCNFLA